MKASTKLVLERVRREARHNAAVAALAVRSALEAGASWEATESLRCALESALCDLRAVAALYSIEPHAAQLDAEDAADAARERMDVH